MSRIQSLKIKAKILQKNKAKAGKAIRLKEAFEIVAKSAGYHCWRSMKQDVERHAVYRPSGVSLPYWNNWYRSYEEAKAFLREGVDFLLPFENQFFICGVDYLEALGIAKDDPDIGLVGSDWVTPKDQLAWERLIAKIKKSAAGRASGAL